MNVSVKQSLLLPLTCCSANIVVKKQHITLLAHNYLTFKSNRTRICEY